MHTLSPVATGCATAVLQSETYTTGNWQSGPNRSKSVRFAVFLRLHGPDFRTLVRRAMKVWIVFTNDTSDTLYFLKDSWIQAIYVDSEVLFLVEMPEALEECVLKLIGGRKVSVKDFQDCTSQYCVDIAHRKVHVFYSAKNNTYFINFSGEIGQAKSINLSEILRIA